MSVLPDINQVLMAQREALARQLQCYIPLQDFSMAQVQAACRDCEIEYLIAGQVLLYRGECDHDAVYLLSGTLRLQRDDELILQRAGDACSAWPVADVLPRQFEVVAETDAAIIRIPRERISASSAWGSAARLLERELAEQGDVEQEWLQQLLRSNLFYKVPPTNVLEVLRGFRSRPVKAGEVVVREGDKADACFIIHKGEASVFQHREGRTEHVAVLPEGSCFGEDGLLSNAPRNATVRMNGDGELRVLDKQSFVMLLRDSDLEELTLAEARREVMSGGSWLDVRTEAEFERAHCRGAGHLPLEQLSDVLEQLSDAHAYICYCDSGHRAAVAAYFLRRQGINAYSLAGGYARYAMAGQALLQ
jgi:CRP-like cAMP-binding protein